MKHHSTADLAYLTLHTGAYVYLIYTLHKVCIIFESPLPRASVYRGMDSAVTSRRVTKCVVFWYIRGPSFPLINSDQNCLQLKAATPRHSRGDKT